MDDSRIIRERKTVEEMIKLYCHKHHGTSGRELCQSCNDLLFYAYKKIETCRFLPDKPTCRNCTVHCYAKSKKEAIRDVMRFSGPKMMFRFPGLTTLHFIDGWKDKKRIEKFPVEKNHGNSKPAL